MREKFFGAGTDIYSNAFGCLWWMAELSYDEDAEAHRMSKFPESENWCCVYCIHPLYVARPDFSIPI
jgi:hypothetical protein